jgi:type IV secretion system protein VirB6
MAVSDVINSVFTSLDQVGTSSLQSLYTSLSSALQPVFTIGMTIYVAYYGYEVWFGRATMSATEFFWRILRMAIVYTLVFNWGNFQTLVSNVLLQTADSVAGTICTTMSGATGASTACPSASTTSSGYTAVASGLEAIWEAGSGAAAQITAAGGTFGVGLMLLGLLLDAVTLFVIIEAIFILVMGKLGLYVLLGLAPIFIALALFEISSSVFTGGMRTCLSLALIPLLTYGFLGFFLGLINAQLSALNSAVQGSSIAMLQIAPFALLCVVATLLLSQIPSLASSITGGAGLRHSSPIGVAEGIVLAGAIRGSGRLMGRGIGKGIGMGVSAAGRVMSVNSGPPPGSGSGNGMSAGVNGMGGGSAAARQIAAGLKANRT